MRVKKRTTAKTTAKSSKYHAKTQSNEHTAKDIWRDAVQRMKEIEHTWRHKLGHKTQEFKQKLIEVMEDAYVKAYQHLSKVEANKLKAKAKALSQAEAKFEKRFADEISKLRKPLHKVKTAISKASKEASNKLSEFKKSAASRAKKIAAKQARKSVQVKTYKAPGKKAGKKNNVTTASKSSSSRATKASGRPAKNQFTTLPVSSARNNQRVDEPTS